MPSTLAAIGFTFADATAFQTRMLKLAADTIERLGCAAGDYAIWRSRTGAEIWFHLSALESPDDGRDIAGLTPFFEGTSEVALEITDRLRRPDDNPFEGAFVALGPSGAALTFDAVDFAAHAGRDLPFRCHVRLCGFAWRVCAIGTGTPDAAVPCSTVELSAGSAGKVVEIRQLTNEASGGPFIWLQLECLGASFDVVAEPAAIAAGVMLGALVEVRCRMFGRLIDFSSRSRIIVYAA